MDLTEYRTTIESHKQQMASHVNSMVRFQSRFDDKIRQAKIYPNWAVGVFVASLVLGVGAMVMLILK